MTAHVEHAIVKRLADYARELGRHGGSEGVEPVLQDLAMGSVQSLPGAQYCGLTVATRDGDVKSVVASHRHAAVLDDIQRECRQGPCLSAAWHEDVTQIDDLSEDDRWPDYRREALARTPVRSVLSFHLFTDRQQIGALNFYADRPRAFAAEAREFGLILASHTALAWHLGLRDREFRRALASRDVIGQAKGILMERFSIDAVQAFELLKRLSQESNTAVVDIAERLVSADRPAA